jgi:hypothetical protein
LGFMGTENVKYIYAENSFCPQGGKILLKGM